MEGQPLLEAFDDPPRLESRPTWEPESDLVQRVEEDPTDSMTDELQEALAELATHCEPNPIDVENELQESARLHRQVIDFNRARSLLAVGRIAAATRLFEALQRELPGEAQIAIELAQCRLRLGDVEQCRRLVDRPFDRPSDRQAADYLLGRAELADGRPNEAISYFQQVEDGREQSSELLINVGTAYLTMGRLVDALRVFERVLTIDGESIHAWLGVSRARLACHDADGAVAAARQAIALRHDDPWARYLLALGLEALGKIEEAVQALEVCIRLQPTIPTARSSLKSLRRRLGRERAAVVPRPVIRTRL
jgi:tetratricopeptide (TPR) repeat protein